MPEPAIEPLVSSTMTTARGGAVVSVELDTGVTRAGSAVRPAMTRTVFASGVPDTLAVVSTKFAWPGLTCTESIRADGPVSAFAVPPNITASTAPSTGPSAPERILIGAPLPSPTTPAPGGRPAPRARRGTPDGGP